MKPMTALWALGLVAWLVQLQLKVAFLSVEIVSIITGLIATIIWLGER